MSIEANKLMMQRFTEFINTASSRELRKAGAHSFDQLRLADLQSGVDLPYTAIKTNIADSLNILIQIERRQGRRYISEVLEINSYNHDADVFDCSVIYNNQAEKP